MLALDKMMTDECFEVTVFRSSEGGHATGRLAEEAGLFAVGCPAANFASMTIETAPQTHQAAPLILAVTCKLGRGRLGAARGAAAIDGNRDRLVLATDGGARPCPALRFPMESNQSEFSFVATIVVVGRCRAASAEFLFPRVAQTH